MTDRDAPDVILLRSADVPDAYLDAFERAGLQAVCEPVLTFRFPASADLQQRLVKTERYAHLVATSPRAVQALRDAFSSDSTLHDAWQGRTAFAVGPKTGRALSALGLDVQGTDAGSAAALVDGMAAATLDGRVLFVSGSRRRDTLPNGLREHGVPFDEVVVYETHVRSDLSLPPPSAQRWLVFFSPSGLDAVRHAGHIDASAYRLAAIGPTTAGTLESAGLHVEAVASTPGPEPLVAALQHAMETDALRRDG
jgi:uroporphyrinogen-III synthase